MNNNILLNYLTQNNLRVVGVDIDEVLSDTINHILQKVNNIIDGKKYYFSDIKSYYLPDIGIKKEIAFELFNEIYLNDEKLNIPVIKNAFEFLYKFKKLGYKIILVTARNDKFTNYTLNWLNKNFAGLFDNVIFASHYTAKHKNKSQICIENDIKVFVEDNHGYCVDLSDNGIQTFLINKPWNISLTDNGHKIVRVNDLLQL